MGSVTLPLREEHKELVPHIEQLRAVADQVGATPPEALRGGVEEAYAFLTRHLIPHAQAEDEALYPVVAQVMGAPEAPGTMRRDHVEIGRLIGELGALRPQIQAGVGQEQERALRRVLYGLYTLVRVHFVKEEEVYLPLLDARLAPEQAAAMFKAMEAAAGRAKAAAAA